MSMIVLYEVSLPVVYYPFPCACTWVGMPLSIACHSKGWFQPVSTSFGHRSILGNGPEPNADAEAEHHERGGSGASASGGWPRKPSWAEKVRGSTQKWQAKAKPPEDEPEEELKDEQKEEQKEEQRPSWADKVRHSLGH
ncbi:unnamed protein product [Durusdinium trenchii]|uniref:Uncharacterized protein n=1 Tax=Durusdinium trenchii TaxID=1381693 RepID=A0ABP0HZ39_9DINO